MSNIEAFLKEKFNVGLLTEEKIDYDYEVQSDEYEVQSDEFWGVRDGPNAKQTVSFPESGTPIVIPKILCFSGDFDESNVRRRNNPS